MIDPSAALGVLTRAGVDLFTGVPDSLLKEFNSSVATELGLDRHVVAPNEGSAVALAAGHFLATGRPALVYLQNSGMGNTLNPLISLVSRDVYRIPVILMIGWRGEPGTTDEPQHRQQGRVTEEILELLDIPIQRLGPDTSGWESILESSVDQAIQSSGPAAIVVSAGTFSGSTGNDDSDRSELPLRIEVIEAVLDNLRADTFYVATTGYTARELASLRRSRKEPSDHDLLVVGSMGHAASIALGVALARPEVEVVCLDGDGALVMHMGALALIGDRQPPNLGHILLDNRVHESVGGQPSALGGADSVGIARACGYRTVRSCETLEEVAEALGVVADGPWFIAVRLRQGTIPGLPRPEDLYDRGRRFMGALRVE